MAKFFVLWQWESATLLAPGFTALLTSGTGREPESNRRKEQWRADILLRGSIRRSS